jgi:hypothetical protein
MLLALNNYGISIRGYCKHVGLENLLALAIDS